MCSVVQWSILFRRYTSNTGVQLAADIVALGVMLPPSTFFLTGQPAGPDFVIPLVIVWSYISIGLELKRPSETLQTLYGHDGIVALQLASYFFAGTVGIMLIPRVVIWVAQEFCTINVVELDIEEEDDNHPYYYSYTPDGNIVPATATLSHGSNSVFEMEEDLEDSGDVQNNSHDVLGATE